MSKGQLILSDEFYSFHDFFLEIEMSQIGDSVEIIEVDISEDPYPKLSPLS